MGQLTDLHTQLQVLLELVKTELGGQLRVFETPPVQKPETPCVFLLTPDSTFQRLDTMTGEDTVVTVLRLCVDAGDPQTRLLELADTIADVVDKWLWNDPPAPLDRAKRIGMRGVTPIFGVGDSGIPTRGADFPIETQLVRPIQPA
jgi:hypothetical protein